MTPALRLLLALTTAAAVAALPGAAAQAATITVTSTADAGPGTLRQAVTASGNGDTIVLPAGTITLTSGAIVVPAAHALTVAGAGARATIIDGNHASQILITAGALTVTGVTMTDGKGIWGGAIETTGPLTLSDDAFITNEATNGGGAIDIKSPGSGIAAPLTVTRSLFARNSTANVGGALHMSGLGTGTITDSTFTGNRAVGADGGAFSLSSNTPTTTVSLVNDTFVGNSAPPGSGSLFRSGSLQTIRYRNSVFAGNGSDGIGNICDEGGGAHNISDGHNVLDVTDDDCHLVAPGDRSGVAVALSPVADHGGPTDTALPLPGSVLLDAGDANGCPLVDQRGLARPVGSACDIGAVEITPPGATSGTVTSLTAGSATLNGVADGHGLAGTTWHFDWGPTADYGNQTPGGTLAGTGAQGVSDTLAGLPAGMTIHYRLVAADGDGTTYGADQTLSTPPAQASPAPPATAARPRCVVPKLLGLSRTTARRRLTRAHCSLGTVHRRKHAHGTLVVVAQTRAAGKRLASGTKVGLTLGPRPKAKHKKA
jgi:hypothetical protein